MCRIGVLPGVKSPHYGPKAKPRKWTRLFPPSLFPLPPRPPNLFVLSASPPTATSMPRANNRTTFGRATLALPRVPAGRRPTAGCESTHASNSVLSFLRWRSPPSVFLFLFSFFFFPLPSKCPEESVKRKVLDKEPRSCVSQQHALHGAGCFLSLSVREIGK